MALWLTSQEMEGGGREHLQRIAAALLGVTVVDLTEAARYFLTATEKEIWDSRDDFPSTAIPMSPAFYEFQAPTYTWSADVGRQPMPFHAVGYLARMEDIGDEERAMLGQLQAEKWLAYDPRWIVEVSTITELRKGEPASVRMTQY